MNRVFLAFLFLVLFGGLAHAAPKQTETAYLAGGCFWCVEADMAKIPGVIDVVSGYAGGDLKNPTYENHQGHIEAVKVVFDPKKISYRQLLDRFWPTIDPTDAGGQFCDRGHSYETAVWVVSQRQLDAAKASRDAAAARLKQGRMVTPILRFSSFWPAERYHQNYASKNPLRYNVYRQGCGRDRRLRQVWGK
ncbi:MAG TPA: peptide-methionine (S)-S-oxide reductase MsrA [Caulobacteraceae bacterium]|nr:peptide-methionine (S)-S-oxide reductase MsrA [Caulobacteraceae bacterium]